jgi:hypothetical protein
MQGLKKKDKRLRDNERGKRNGETREREQSTRDRRKKEVIINTVVGEGDSKC